MLRKIRSKWPLALVAGACLALCCGATNTPPESRAAPKQKQNTAKDPVAQMSGVTLVADISLDRIDKFRTLGMQKGFGADQPLCDFIATEKWVSKNGTRIRAGEAIKIGKAVVVEATDGYGNTGTKLILESAAPKEGLVFYCYAFNSNERAYWAIDKEKIAQALKGYFHIQE